MICSAPTGERERERTTEGCPVEVSDNIFADLDLKDAEAHYAKVQVVLAIRRLMRERGTTLMAAATHAGVKRSDLSMIVNGRLDRFSTERLTHILNTLG